MNDHQEFVRCPERFASVLEKLRERTASVVFWNCTEQFKLMIRSVGFSDMDASFELCIISDDRDESDDSDDSDDSSPARVLERVLELEYDGWYDPDDSDYFVIDTTSIAVPLCADKVPAFMRIVNAGYDMKICACRRHLVSHCDTMCLRCEMTSTVDDTEEVQCVVCHENGPKMHIKSTPCCSQSIHAGCMSSWVHTKRRGGETATCPMCRATL